MGTRRLAVVGATRWAECVMKRTKPLEMARPWPPAPMFGVSVTIYGTPTRVRYVSLVGIAAASTANSLPTQNGHQLNDHVTVGLCRDGRHRYAQLRWAGDPRSESISLHCRKPPRSSPISVVGCGPHLSSRSKHKEGDSKHGNLRHFHQTTACATY